MKEKISITLNKKTLRSVDATIDRVYIRNRSQAIESIIEKATGQHKIAVILSGGASDRLRVSGQEFRPAVKITDASAIELAVRKLRECKFKQIYIIAQQEVLKEIFNILGNGSKYGIKIEYLEEEKSHGTADSLRMLKGKVNSSFLVIWSDLVINHLKINNLWDDHFKRNAISTLLITTGKTSLEKIAIVKLQGGKITEFKEKPKQPDSVIFFAGVFVAEPEILDYPGSSLERDVFPELVKKNLLDAYVDSSPYLHFHTKKDILKIKKQIAELNIK